MTEVMECDVVIIGAGISGLSAAIRLGQLAKENAQELSIIILEKGSQIGSHILSGAVLEPKALNELLPNWQQQSAPVETAVTNDNFWLLTQHAKYALPVPPQMRNDGNYIISLGNLCSWLGEQAEALGVQVFPGFPAVDFLQHQGKITGVKTGEFGVAKDGSHKDSYQPSMEIRAKYTLFAEGCRGYLAEKLMAEFALREGVNPQTYGIGIKELWEIDNVKSSPGTVIHTIGWPLDSQTYGGSFIYHMAAGKLAIGFVVGLDYQNPYLDPFMEFQRFKHHPAIYGLLEGGRRIGYGARALNEGGLQSIPKLTMPGGLLIGCAAGFLNVPKIKGTHTAMKSGMLAAEAVFAAIDEGRYNAELEDYADRIKHSWIYDELYKARNIRPAFRKGLFAGLLYSALDTYILRGRAPWTFTNHEDHTQLKPASLCKKIEYPAPDGKISFDRLSSVFLSNTNHEENQPVHLKLENPNEPLSDNWEIYAGPAQRFCPAGVYEYIQEGDKVRFQINAQNCVHCKTCDIKDMRQNIKWTPPEGGGGPNYIEM